MSSIRCPHCGSPVTVRGKRWECGWCGDFGSLSSLGRAEKERLLQSQSRPAGISLSVTVTDRPPSGQKE